MVTINGEQVSAAGRTIAEYLAEKGFPQTGIAVALNDTVVPKSKHGETFMKDGDWVEIVHCVQGG
ncbi:MAG: sulfur carrier protein ThiS [Victivallales bacterium]|jgi:sulfur carrier protein|nr:sulfur carrier protein ThiS [Victivallales bacterium]MBR4518191.1 sulfur carrier protein ThiS [Victivallales bacterium]